MSSIEQSAETKLVAPSIENYHLHVRCLFEHNLKTPQQMARGAQHLRARCASNWSIDRDKPTRLVRS